MYYSISSVAVVVGIPELIALPRRVTSISSALVSEVNDPLVGLGISSVAHLNLLLECLDEARLFPLDCLVGGEHNRVRVFEVTHRFPLGLLERNGLAVGVLGRNRNVLQFHTHVE